ncbi:ninein-like [Penaeus monodon]|uniref:ninein-like n=1 Tax=Penaeus monodon TaxID=6687 RepID=UPI0018A7D750|nr:ninein-like [Penaeus monodon]
MDEIRTDEKATKAPGMEKTEESLKSLEKKYEDVLEKHKEYLRDGEKREKPGKKVPEICLPNRLPRMEVQGDEQLSEGASMKSKISLLESKMQALTSALALGKKRMEGNVFRYEERQTKMEQENVKIWEKDRKLVIYQAEANKRKLKNEELEKEEHSLTRKSQELEEICQELNSKEKAAMEKIEDCFRKIKEEEITAEIDTAYERKWTKVHESLSHCDRLVEISNQEIQELKDDTPMVTADRADKQEQDPINQKENELVMVESVEMGESPPQLSDSPVVMKEIILSDSPVVVKEFILNDYPLFDDVTMQDSSLYVEDIARHDSPASTEDIIDITE